MYASTLSVAEQISPEPLKLNQSLDVAPFVANYDVDTNALPLSGNGVRSLKHLGDDHYRMEQVAKSFLLTRREIAEFTMKNCEITPKSYRSEQSGLGRDRRQLLDFNLQTNIVVFEENKKKKDIQLPKDRVYYDPLSETLALQCLLLKQKADKKDQSKPIILHVVDKGSLKEHQFKVTGQDTIRVAKTDMATIRVERVRESNERSTLFWFAPRHNFALVKIKQDNKGKTITFNLESIKQVF